MPDEALENALDRFDVEYLAAHGTMADVLLALKEHKEWVRKARRQLAEALAAREKAEAYLADSRELERLFTAALEHEKKIRGRAEAACAAMRQWIDGLQASAPDSLAQYLLAGHPDPPQDGQALRDERDRYQTALRKISKLNTYVGPVGNPYDAGLAYGHRRAVRLALAALDEKETPHAE